jgi:glycosyltransferase involved in cell wall biosynthesis
MNTAKQPSRTILFSGHDLRFLRLFVAHCQRNGRYTVLLDEHQGHEITNTRQSSELLPRADIIFCEWCLGNAVWYSRNKHPHQRLVIRLHAQEMRLPFLDKIQWDAVDALVLICPRNRDLIRERYPFLAGKLHLIYNPIDCHALDQPKLPGAEFNLGIMGICPMLKAPHLAFEILCQLRQKDSRYRLFVKGKHPREYDWLWRGRPVERAYYERLYKEIDESPHGNSVVLETYGDDVGQWFSKIGFILSTSDNEGSHQSVAEGMASGTIPIIRNWPGSDLIYPPKYVAASVESAVQAVLNWRTLQRYSEEMDFCRGFARAQFDQAGICAKLENLCEQNGGSSNGALEELNDAQVAHPAPQPVLVLGYLPAGFRGGYRIRIEQEIKNLVLRGCPVRLACLHPKVGQAKELEAHREELAALGCDVFMIEIAGFFDIKLTPANIQGALAALGELVSAQGTAIVHAEALYCARIGLLLKQRCPQVRLVFDCHGTGPEEERMSGAHAARVTAMREVERQVLGGADLNVFVSQAMKDFYLKEYQFAQLQHVVVPCCVADERFPKGRTTPRVTLPVRRPILAYLGTMAAWQCAEEMIRLVGQVQQHDPEIFFLALIPKADHAATRERIQKHGLKQDRVLLTELPHDQIASTLRLAHAGLLLRRAHPVNQVSSPTKFGEYLAAGVPVIMTEGIGDFSQWGARDGVGMVLDSRLLEGARYPEEVVLRVSEFTRQSMSEREAIARRCQDFAREHLHWKVAINSLVDGYQSLNHSEIRLAGSPGRAKAAAQL